MPHAWIELNRGRGVVKALRSERSGAYWYTRGVTLFEELAGVIRLFDEQRVEYALVGALAVAVWGAPRATKDIDLLIRPEDLPRAMGLARQRGFTLEAFPMQFQDGMEVQRTNKVDQAGALLTLDFLLVNENLEPIWRTRQRVPFDQSSVTVVSRDALIKMKSAAARPQDIADVQRLKEIDR